MAHKKESSVNTSLAKETTKNSSYKTTSAIITKFGGLALTVILARILGPEPYGLYSLILSMVVILGALVNQGTGQAIEKYVSEKLGQNDFLRARDYFKYIVKIRFLLLGIFVFLLVLLSKTISLDIYGKPEMFIPLLASSAFLLTKSVMGIFSSILVSSKDFKSITKNKVIFQTFRVLFPLLAIALLSKESALIGVFFGLALAAALSGIIYYLSLGEKKGLLKGKQEKVDNSRINAFIFYLVLTGVSVKIFGSVDTLMLGKFVSSEYLGFYRAALNLVLAVSALFAFSNVLLPAFTRISGKRLERGFQRTFRYVALLSIPAVFGIAAIGKYFVLAVYGKEYITSAIPLYALSLIILVMPLSSLYSSLFKVKENARTLSSLVGYSLLLNIILNYLLIKYLPEMFNGGPELAILGAAIATTMSRIFYVVLLGIKSKAKYKISTNFNGFLKFFLASIGMAGFLIVFSYFVDVNAFIGILLVLFGAGIYFGLLYLINGIERKDVDLFREVFVKKIKGVISKKKV